MVLTDINPDWTGYRRWMCPKPATYDYPLCYEHWRWFNSFETEECERCHRFESVEDMLWRGDDPVALCGDCLRGVIVPVYIHAPIERQTRWLYILKMDNGRFYVGQTNDLEIRLGEHRDGETKSTAGQHPRLVWFESWLGNRDKLDEEEKRLTKLANNSPRAIRRMVNEWQRPLRLLDLSP